MSRLELVAESQAQESGFLALADIASSRGKPASNTASSAGSWSPFTSPSLALMTRPLARRSMLIWASRNRLPLTLRLSLGWKVWDMSARNQATGSSARARKGDAW